MNLDLLARSAAADLHDAAARSVDIEAALARLAVTRRRRAAARGAVVALVLAAIALTTVLTLRPAVDAPPADRHPTPTPTQPLVDTRPTEFPVRVPPLCFGQWPRLGRFGDPRLEGPARCPARTPAGDYVSMIVGTNTVRPFTFDLPNEWEVVTVDDFPTSGVDIRSVDGRAGLTVLPYAEPRERNVPMSNLLRWLERQPEVRVRRLRTLDLAGMSVAVLDLTPAAGARLTDGCRLVAPCLPIVRAGLAEAVPPATKPPVAVELRPGVTSRLFVARGSDDSDLSPAVWLWDSGPGPRQDEARAVLRSLDMLAARGPMPPDSRP